MNDINKLGNANVWIMCSEGFASDFDTLLDNMIETGKDTSKITLINRNNGCSTFEVDKKWLIDQLCD